MWKSKKMKLADQLSKKITAIHAMVDMAYGGDECVSSNIRTQVWLTRKRLNNLHTTVRRWIFNG
jgi:hypothetical protein